MLSLLEEIIQGSLGHKTAQWSRIATLQRAIVPDPLNEHDLSFLSLALLAPLAPAISTAVG